jgi:hypothetical protein
MSAKNETTIELLGSFFATVAFFAVKMSFSEDIRVHPRHPR